MKTINSQKGFFSMAAVLFLGVIALSLLMVHVSQTLFMARRAQIHVLQEQAYWLSQSTIERALNSITQSQGKPDNQQHVYIMELAPVFIDNDPLLHDHQSEFPPVRILSATCTWSAATLTREDLPSQILTNAISGYQFAATSEIEYRNLHLIHSLQKICYQSQDGTWNCIPLTAEQ
ncbi:MAG: hypothetical protein ACOX5R_07270 [bacterium]|jgi:hypothetical protein